MSPVPLNSICANVEHIRPAAKVIELILNGLPIEIGFCNDCAELLPEPEGELIDVKLAGEVLGVCMHGYDLDHVFCPHGCRV